MIETKHTHIISHWNDEARDYETMCGVHAKSLCTKEYYEIATCKDCLDTLFPITTGSIIRLGPWVGRVVDTLTSDTTGERYARVKLVKHTGTLTEIQPVSDLKHATYKELFDGIQEKRTTRETEWDQLLR